MRSVRVVLEVPEDIRTELLVAAVGRWREDGFVPSAYGVISVEKVTVEVEESLSGDRPRGDVFYGPEDFGYPSTP